jgi:hypothetical protein
MGCEGDVQGHGAAGVHSTAGRQMHILPAALPVLSIVYFVVKAPDLTTPAPAELLLPTGDTHLLQQIIVLQRVRAALEGTSNEQRTSALLEDDPTYK